MYSDKADVWGCKKERRVGHKGLRARGGNIETFDPHPIESKKCDDEQKWIEEFEEWWNEGFKFLSPGYKEVMQGCWLESRRRLKDELL